MIKGNTHNSQLSRCTILGPRLVLQRMHTDYSLIVKCACYKLCHSHLCKVPVVRGSCLASSSSLRTSSSSSGSPRLNISPCGDSAGTLLSKAGMLGRVAIMNSITGFVLTWPWAWKWHRVFGPAINQGHWCCWTAQVQLYSCIASDSLTND